MMREVKQIVPSPQFGNKNLDNNTVTLKSYSIFPNLDPSMSYTAFMSMVQKTVFQEHSA